MDNNIHYDLVRQYFGQLTGDMDTDLKLSALITDAKKKLAGIDAINNDILKSDFAKKQETDKIFLDVNADLHQKVRELLKPILDKPMEAHRAVVQALMPEPTNSDIKELIRVIQQTDDRAALRGMSIEQRSQVVRDLAAKGNRRGIDAAESSLDLSQGLGLEASKDLYLKEAKPNLLQEARDAENTAVNSRMMEQILPVAINKLGTEFGLNVSKIWNERQAARSASMTPEQKAAYISQHGATAYQNFITDGASPTEEVDNG